MRKIAVTGGIRGGKSTILQVLERSFGNHVLVVPEVATMLLEKGWPMPRRDIEWSPQWQELFQGAIAAVQPRIEQVYEMRAHECGAKILVCDRGILDGAAYTVGGLKEFCRVYGVDADQARARYEIIFHLESTATGDPDDFLRDMKKGNEVRYEQTLEEAVGLEYMTRAAWQEHPQWTFLGCVGGLEGKIRAVCNTVRSLIAGAKIGTRIRRGASSVCTTQ